MEKIDTDNKEFQEALNLIKFTRQSVFLTGKAGTGKSTFLRYVCENVKKKHVVLAPTGIAAINAGGSTLHSFFKLPFHPLLPDDPNFGVAKGRIYKFFKYTKAHQKMISEVELIIIDEISMVRADIIDAIDRILRVFSHNLREPFGGKQLLFVGDVFQLEPVITGDERDIINRAYPTPFFFSARVFNQMNLVSVELKKVYRQTDAVFVGMLDRIRNNTMTNADLQLLNMRCNTRQEVNDQGLFITLATRRNQVDYINDTHLAQLDGESVIFKGKIEGDFPESSLPTLPDLELKVGAQIIFVKNDMERRWVNGTIGVIIGMDEENSMLYIETDDGRSVDVETASWNNIRYHYNEEKKEIEEEVLGSFVQFPVKLAWAITVHKSQGLTFSKVSIDFTGGAFAAGQTYVALSRCTSMEGISLTKPIARTDVIVHKEIVNFAQRYNNQAAIDLAMKQARADMEYLAALQTFDKGDMESCIEHFLIAIHARYDIEKPNIRRLIRRKLGVVNQLRSANKRLTEEMAQQRANLQKYAKEYLQMGNECITQAHDVRAALANYNKAIDLYPQYADAWVRKGITLFNDNKLMEAKECFNKAVALQPTNFKAFYNRGSMYLQLNEIDSALADLDKATSLKPEHAGAHMLFADVLSKADKEEEADVHRRIAEELKKKKKRK